jgi:ankyrin repeat protein
VFRCSASDPSLFYAAGLGKLDVVRCLVRENGADVNQSEYEGASFLCIAAHEGHLDVVCCLVNEYGADVNQAKKDRATPLLIAVQKGQFTVVRFLAEHGADINQALSARWNSTSQNCCQDGPFDYFALSCH